jgi:hypothetical protein
MLSEKSRDPEYLNEALIEGAKEAKSTPVEHRNFALYRAGIARLRGRLEGREV